MANLDFKFVNVEKSAALEEYAREHIRNLMRRLDRAQGDTKFIEVLFRSESKKAEGTLNSVEVQITYKHPGIRQAFHVKKHGSDLRSVLDEVITALENSVERAVAKKVGSRRKKTKSSIAAQEINVENLNPESA